MNKMFSCLLAGLILAPCLFSFSQDRVLLTKKNGGFPITLKKGIACTGVKDQYHSGTCWSFSTESFLESELLRKNKLNTDLSEMFVVHNMYLLKAEQYIRRQGNASFGAGGEAGDVMLSLKNYGLMPQSAYTGNPEADGKPRHNEMDALLKAMLDSFLKLADSKLSPHWHDAFSAVLDAYLGKIPETFTYEGKTYTPKSFAQAMNMNADDYVAITSFTHHPFYKAFPLEVADNWSYGNFQNVPLDELEMIIDNAIDKGFTVSWSSDVSEKGFSFRNGVAIVPEQDFESMPRNDKDSIFTKPILQKTITQEYRQTAFDNLSTTDDHAMHISGYGVDALGQKYYYVKNSWGTESNDLNGYFFVSASYIRYKTTSILLHKDALSTDIKQKMGL